MRLLSFYETFPILIIVVHSHAYSPTFRTDGASTSAISSNAESEPLVLEPDEAVLSFFSNEAESQSSLFASEDMNRGISTVDTVEGQGNTKGQQRTQELIGNVKDECPLMNHRNKGKMRVRQLSCPAKPMQDIKTPATGQRTETAPRRTVQPDEMPEILPYIPLQFLKPDRETCSPSLVGKGTVFSAPNTPVCSTGLDQVIYPLGPKTKFVTLQECFPYNPWYKCPEPEFLWCCGLVSINYDKTRRNMNHDLHNSWVYIGEGCVPINPPPDFIGPRGLP